MILKDKQAIAHYFVIYMMIASQGAFIMMLLGSDLFNIICMAIWCLYFCQSRRIDKSFFVFVSGTIGLLLMTIAYTHGGLSLATSISILNRILLVYVAIMINKKEFIARLLNVLFFLAVISVVQYILFLIFGASTFFPLYSKLPYHANSYGLIFTRVVLHQLGRNNGIFGEPGQYQIVISLAIYLLLIFGKQFDGRKRKIYLITFLVTLVTIQSAAGYISLLIVIAYVLFENKEIIPTFVRRIGLLFCLIAIIYMVNADEDSFVYINFINKIMSSDGTLNIEQSSGAARVKGITDVLEVFWNHPSTLLGAGYSGVEKYKVETCAGLFTFLLMVGIPCFIWILCNLIAYLWRGKKSTRQVVFAISLIVNFYLSQPNFLPVAIVIICAANYFLNDTEYWLNYINISRLDERKQL